MPKSFLVKKKIDRCKKLSTASMISSPGNGYVRELNQLSAYPSGQIEYTQPSLASNKVEFPLKVASEPKNFHSTNIFLSPSLGITNSLAEKNNRNDEVVKQALVARNNSNEFSIASGNRIADAKIAHISSKNQCQYCNKTYTSLTNLLRHQQFHCNPHQKRPFHCKYCEKLYVSLGALKMHIRTHTLPCKCKICGKAFSRPWLLQGHVRTHTGEKPYKCINCQRAFADRSNLRAHLQTHSDVKKYCCPRCSKSFSRMSLLLKHEDSCPAHSKLHGSQ